MSARPLAADEAVELSEILSFTADVLDDGGDDVLAAAAMDASELRATLLSWAMRLLDTPAGEGMA